MGDGTPENTVLWITDPWKIREPIKNHIDFMEKYERYGKGIKAVFNDVSKEQSVILNDPVFTGHLP